MKVAAFVLSSALIGAACAAPAPRASESVPAIVPTPAPVSTPTAIPVQAIEPLPASAVRPIASPSPAVLPLSVLAGRSGSDLRVALDVLLDENAFLLALAIDAASNARLDELIGASSSLDENSRAVAEIVGTVMGQPAAEVLLDGWRGEISDLIGYAQGQQTSASEDLPRRQAAIAAQITTGSLSENTAADLVGRRTQSEVSLAESIIARNPTQSSERLESLVRSSDDLGAPLAAAMASQLKDLSPQTTEGADVDLRLHLVDALQQYVYLTGAAMEAAADSRSADLRAYSDAASRNAHDLGNQLTAVYSAPVGDGVADRLQAQTSAFVSAASGGDRQQAASDIDRARADIDSLLAGANQLLAPGLIAQQLRSSNQPLLTAADAFAGRDYPTAFARLREAARASQKPADTLAQTAVDRYPGRYLNLPPSGGSRRSVFRGAARR